MLYSECQETFECVFHKHFQSVNVVHFLPVINNFMGEQKKKKKRNLNLM